MLGGPPVLPHCVGVMAGREDLEPGEETRTPDLRITRAGQSVLLCRGQSPAVAYGLVKLGDASVSCDPPRRRRRGSMRLLVQTASA